MRYYIIMPDDDGNEDYSTNILGESSFKNFWADQGFEILVRLIEKYPDTLETVKIKDDQSKEYSIEDFLNITSKLNIIRN
jgi:hypothetical protein